MKRALYLPALVFLLLPLWRAPAASAEGGEYWPQWRGPNADGTSLSATPPIEWSEQKNIRWKVSIAGKGSASPIVWGDKVFVQTAVPTGEAAAEAAPAAASPAHRRRGPRGIQPGRVLQFMVIALDRGTGRKVWETIVRKEKPHEGTHPTGSWASASPLTDGHYLYAFFGSRGLYCLDLDGNVIWEKDLGDMQIRLGFGEGSSPVLAGDRLIVNWDHEGPSFIVALDKATGEEVWRTQRDEVTSWSSPLVVAINGRQQVITSATTRVRSYDVETGELIWESSGMTVNPIPTPVAADGIVYLTSGFRGSALLAVNLAEARGNITGSDAIVWSHHRDTPYTPSPLLYKGVLYFLKSNNGILSAFNATTGEPVFPTRRLEGLPNVYASPVGAANRVYLAGREGTTIVLEHGAAGKVLAVNKLDDGFDASPALVDGEIYLRGKEWLYCIAED